MAGLTRHAVSLRDGDALGAVKTVVGPHHLTEIVPERALVLPRPRDPVDEKQYTGDVTRLKQPFDEGRRGAGLPVPVAISTSKLAASAAQERWSMDFMCESGWQLHMRTVLDQYTRACSLLLADTPIGGRKVAAALAKGTEGIGLAQTMTVDNGPEFAGSTRSAGLWPQHGTGFFRPSKPVENGYIESFNGHLRDEIPNALRCFVR